MTALLAAFIDVRGWRSVLVRICPLWWIYMAAVISFVSHDCQRNRFRCWVGERPIDMLGWLDRWQSKDWPA